MFRLITKTASVLAFSTALTAANAVLAQQIVDGDTPEGDAILNALADLVETQESSSSRTASVPAIPSAINVAGGTAFISGTVSGPRDAQPNGDADASFALGVGFGDASTGVGIQLVANVTEVDPVGDSGYFSLQFSRQLNGLRNPTWIALTASNLGGWGDSEVLNESVSVQMSQIALAGNVPIMWTVGVGNEVRTDKATDREGAFAGIGAGLADNFTAGISTNFDVINAGASYSVPGTNGMSVALTATDVAARRGETVFSLTLGYAFQDLF